MIVSGANLSLFGRSALPSVASSRASARDSLDPVQPTARLQDPTASEYQEWPALKQHDREVSQHEQAPVMAGGEARTGTVPTPDDPAATITKMQVVRGAAPPPADPAAATRTAAEARVDLRAGPFEEQRGEGESHRSAQRAEPALDAYRGAAAIQATNAATPVLDLTV